MVFSQMHQQLPPKGSLCILGIDLLLCQAFQYWTLLEAAALVPLVRHRMTGIIHPHAKYMAPWMYAAIHWMRCGRNGAGKAGSNAPVVPLLQFPLPTWSSPTPVGKTYQWCFSQVDVAGASLERQIGLQVHFPVVPLYIRWYHCLLDFKEWSVTMDLPYFVNPQKDWSISMTL